jgi:uncharacterized protein (TIGR00269 family)
MHCKRCKNNKGEIYLKSYNLYLCRGCFFELFKKRVIYAIDRFKMFSPSNKILVAVSGGKDSLALWSVLNELGYLTVGFYINLGIEGYSQYSEEKVIKFAKERELPFKVVRIKEILGRGIREISQIVKKAPCRICGMIKRYIMNREAKDFFCIATGHNLDDEASQLLGNIINWQKGYLGRQYPVLEDNQSLKRKVKPLCFCLEQEIAFYAFLKKIDYIQDECPLSKGATSLFYKEILNRIEEKMPSTKIRFYKQFLRQNLFRDSEDKIELKPCANCGYLTVSKLCNFCRLKEKVLINR